MKFEVRRLVGVVELPGMPNKAPPFSIPSLWDPFITIRNENIIQLQSEVN